MGSGMLLLRLLGHWWTVAPTLREFIVPTPTPPSTSWQRSFDTRWGPARVTGLLSAPPGATELLLVVHGLG